MVSDRSQAIGPLIPQYKSTVENHANPRNYLAHSYIFLITADRYFLFAGVIERTGSRVFPPIDVDCRTHSPKTPNT
jgi:hypothetical protein